MASFDAALQRFNIALSDLEARLNAGAHAVGADPEAERKAEAEAARLRADLAQLQAELDVMRDEERRWSARADDAARQVDAAITEVRALMEQ